MSGNLHYLKTHGSLTILKDWIATNPVSGKRFRACRVKCDCGIVIRLLNYAHVKGGLIKDCGCKL
jgi:hypothetical protein